MSHPERLCLAIAERQLTLNDSMAQRPPSCDCGTWKLQRSPATPWGQPRAGCPVRLQLQMQGCWLMRRCQQALLSAAVAAVAPGQQQWRAPSEAQLPTALGRAARAAARIARMRVAPWVPRLRARKQTTSCLVANSIPDPCISPGTQQAVSGCHAWKHTAARSPVTLRLVRMVINASAAGTVC
jgi:hypothetical protein